MQNEHTFGSSSWNDLDELYYYLPGFHEPSLDRDPDHSASVYDLLWKYAAQIRQFVGHPGRGVQPPPPHPRSRSFDGQLSWVAKHCFQIRQESQVGFVAILTEMKASMILGRDAKTVEHNITVIQSAVSAVRELKMRIMAMARKLRLSLFCEPLRRAIESAGRHSADSFAALEQVLGVTRLSNPVLVPEFDPKLIESYAVRNWWPPDMNTEVFCLQEHHPIDRILAIRFGIWVRTYLLKILTRYNEATLRGQDPGQYPLTAVEVYHRVTQRIIILEEQRHTLHETQRKLMTEGLMTEPTAQEWALLLLRTMSRAFKHCLQIDPNTDCFLVDELDHL